MLDWTERLRKFDEEEHMKMLAAEQAAAEQAAQAAAAAAAEMNAEKQDDSLQLFDKPCTFMIYIATLRVPEHFT